MKKFEYKELTVQRGSRVAIKKNEEQFATEINALGAEGWELITANGNPTVDGFITLFFKRELTQ